MATWKTDPISGLVTVDFGDETGPQQLKLSTFLATQFKSKVIDPWGALIEKYANKTGVPFAHIAGLINRESGGSASVISFDGGVGLMQITSKALKAGHTNQELTDPELNIDIGTNYFSGLWHGQNGDLPRACAAYNAGGAKVCGPSILNCCHNCCPTGDPKMPCKLCSCNEEWNLVATKGHISGVVSSSNTAILNGWAPDTSGPPIVIVHPPIQQPPIQPQKTPILAAGVAPTTSSGMLCLAAGGALGYFGWKYLSGFRKRA